MAEVKSIVKRLGAAVSAAGDALRGRMSFQGAKTRRIDPDWNPKPIGINAQIDADLGTLKARARWLCHSDPYIARAARTVVNNTVGSGIVPVPKTPWPEVNQQLHELISESSRRVDIGREASLHQLEQLMAAELFNGGEVLPYFPTVSAWRGVPAGPAIELIPGERLDHTLSARLPSGGKVRQGVEFDAEGRRVAYHVLAEMPRDGVWGSFSPPAIGGPNMRRIDALDASLVFRPITAGQIRGVPWCVAAIETIRFLGRFNQAYLDLAQIAACISVWIEGNSSPFKTNPGGSSENIADVSGEPITELAPGMIGVLPQGSKVNIASPNLPPPAMEMVQRLLLRAVAASIGVSYSRLACDYSQTTFSAARAEAIEDRIGYRPVQELIYTGLVHPWYTRMVPYWLASGKLTLTPEQRAEIRRDVSQLLRCDPGFPGNDWISPGEESKATVLALEAGIDSLKGVCAALGKDWRRVVDDRLEVEQYMRERRTALGLPEPAPSTITINEAPQPAQPNQQPDEPAAPAASPAAPTANRSVA